MFAITLPECYAYAAAVSFIVRKKTTLTGFV